MARTLIDLSMPVHNEMITFPRVVRPALVMYETWQGFAERIGATKYGVDSLTAHYMVVLGDHIGTHMDSLRHMRENAPGPEAVPLEYCYGEGICLDFRHLPKGAGISVQDMRDALAKIKYTLKPLDIVLIHTGAGKIQDSEKYLTDHVGMTGESTNWPLPPKPCRSGFPSASGDWQLLFSIAGSAHLIRLGSYYCATDPRYWNAVDHGAGAE